MTEHNETQKLYGFDVDPSSTYTKEDNSWIWKVILPAAAVMNVLMVLWAVLQPSSFMVPTSANDGNPNLPFIMSLLVLAGTITAVVFMLYKVMIDMTLASNRFMYFMFMVGVLILGALNSWLVFGPHGS